MSDGLIITGNKTGSPASLSDIKGKHLTCGHILVVPRIRCRGIHASNLFQSGCCKQFYAVFMTCVQCRRQNNFFQYNKHKSTITL